MFMTLLRRVRRVASTSESIISIVSTGRAAAWHKGCDLVIASVTTVVYLIVALTSAYIVYSPKEQPKPMLNERDLAQGELWQAFIAPAPEPEPGQPPPEVVLLSTYSRDEAIADGVLVDVTEYATFVGGSGFRIPVVMTRTLFDLCESIPESKSWQDPVGRIHDVVWMGYLCFKSLVKAIEAGKLTEAEASCWFYDLIMHHDRYTYITLKMQFDGTAVTLGYAWSGKRSSKKQVRVML